MLQQLLNHIDRHSLCKTTDKILLAVSGGIDSMVMLDLFLKSGFSIAVAHCNFQLRGSESDGDETLVAEVCRQNGVAFYSKKFETQAYAAGQEISIQMAARDLRYEFFKNVQATHHYAVVATAHHFDDNIETFFVNLFRGTGLEGLCGIPVKNGDIIRPMLFTTREKIYQYAVDNNLTWREDSSNASTDYQRNFIRHEIMPLVRQVNPGFTDTFRNTLERLKSSCKLTAQALVQFKREAVEARADGYLILKNKLYQFAMPHVLLWELIKDQGFNLDQCRDMVATGQSGKVFYSSTHQLTIDRESLMVTSRVSNEQLYTLIAYGQYRAKSVDQQLELEELSIEKFKLAKDPAIAQLDHDKIRFPLVWRSWKEGDAFVPLGMDRHKKLSDFFIDKKLPLPDKKKITVIESNGEIVWVVGHRISEQFKVDDATRKVLVIRQSAGEKKSLV
ncbi:MAG: tRNA lysidine(34) synthetase TilS [Bacteroidota bacterium]